MIEMMIVVAIIAIGLLVALPRTRALIVRQQVDRTAQVVASDIRAAFTSAARGRVPVRIAFSTTTTVYAITNKVTGDTIIRRNFGSGDVRVTGVTGTSAIIDVYPNGIASGPDTITVAGSGYSRLITLSRVGFVRVLPPTSP